MPPSTVKRLNERLLSALTRHVEMHQSLVRRYSFAEAIMYDQYNEGLVLNDFLHFCYAKSARSLDAVRTLLEHGFREDPMILMRSIYENYLSFWYVFRNNDALDAFVEAKVGKKSGAYLHPRSGVARHLRVVDPETGAMLDYGRSVSELARNGSPRIANGFHLPFYEYLSEFSHSHFIAMGGYLASKFRGKYTADRPGLHLETTVLAVLLSTLWMECLPMFEDMDEGDVKESRNLARRARLAMEAAADELVCDANTQPFLDEIRSLLKNLETPVAL